MARIAFPKRYKSFNFRDEALVRADPPFDGAATGKNSWRRSVVLRAFLRSAVLAAATAGVVPTLLAPRPALALQPNPDPVLSDLNQQKVILTSDASTPAAREEAARRLVSRSSPEADAILLGVLDGVDAAPRLAVTRALAQDPTPSEPFISRLLPLLGPDAALSEAAARALVVFKNNDTVRDRLLQFVTSDNQRVASRTAVARALGRLVDKRTAGQLVEILNSGQQNPLIRDAAADALIEMTNDARNGRDAQRWNQWWQANRNKNEQQWLNEVLSAASRRTSDIELRLQALRETMERKMREEFSKLPDDQRGKYLVANLQDASDDVRAFAARMAYGEVALAGRKDPQVLEALRKLIGDSSAEVRDRVARTLGLWNDPVVVKALLTQLAQENDLDVRVSILTALGPTHDLQAIPPLLQFLDDSTLALARAAADALKHPDMAQELRKPSNADTAQRVADALARRLRDTDRNNPASQQLRESVVEAMSRLGHATFNTTFQELLNARESERIRLGALRGFELLAMSESANHIVPALRDPVPGIRVAACTALRTTGSADYAKDLFKLISGREQDEDPDVRKAAWETMVALLEKADSPDALKTWVDSFKDPTPEAQARKQKILELQEAKYAALVAAGKTNLGNKLAEVREELGVTLLDLNSAEPAAEKLRACLDYWDKTPNTLESVKNRPRQLLFLALVRAKKPDVAMQFVGEIVRVTPAYAETVMPDFRKEMDRLLDAKDFDLATAMVKEARKVLPEAKKVDLDRADQLINARRAGGGRIYVRWLELLDLLLDTPASRQRIA